MKRQVTDGIRKIEDELGPYPKSVSVLEIVAQTAEQKEAITDRESYLLFHRFPLGERQKSQTEIAKEWNVSSGFVRQTELGIYEKLLPYFPFEKESLDRPLERIPYSGKNKATWTRARNALEDELNPGNRSAVTPRDVTRLFEKGNMGRCYNEPVIRIRNYGEASHKVVYEVFEGIGITLPKIRVVPFR